MFQFILSNPDILSFLKSKMIIYALETKLQNLKLELINTIDCYNDLSNDNLIIINKLCK